MSLNVKHQYVIEFGEGSEYEFITVSEALYKALKDHFNPPQVGGPAKEGTSSLLRAIREFNEQESKKRLNESSPQQPFPPTRPWKDDIRPDINPLYPPNRHFLAGTLPTNSHMVGAKWGVSYDNNGNEYRYSGGDGT